jgi:1-deoxy-D-xylulose-5-phosphate synthase
MTLPDTRAILSKLQSPQDVRRLDLDELRRLAEECRQLIIDVVMRNGGHLGSNLGVVELTLALLHVFDMEQDVIVWDGAYQTYTYKLLTGRRDRFSTLRQMGGICGFGWKPESRYDPFNFGHVGTALGASLGLTLGDEKLGRKRKVITVVGDGALTCGVAFEALNNIGGAKRDQLIVFNDNGFSIAPTVGALSTYFTELRTLPIYQEFKRDLQTIFDKIPRGQKVEQVLDSVRRGLRQSLFPNIFTAFGLNYYGPIDGHDLKALITILRNVKNRKGPVLLHVITKKAKGHPDADKHPFALHKPPDSARQKFVRTDIREDKLEPAARAPEPPQGKSYTKAFVEALSAMARSDPRIVAITAAMPDGTGLLDFGREFPDRMFDVGISEQQAVTFAAGLAAAGMRPLCAIYSSFNQRAYDQIFQEMCLNHLPVVLVLDRAGIAGEDGPTHHGNFDIAYLRPLPNLTLMAPADESDLRQMLGLALGMAGPSAIRLPRENVPDFSAYGVERAPLAPGKGELLAKGRDGAILAYGVMVEKALRARRILAAEGIDVAVANARFAKPVDGDLAALLTRNYKWVLTAEDHTLWGGFGSAVLETLSLRGEATQRVKIHAIPDRFLTHADRPDLLRILRLDAEGLADVCRQIAVGQPRPEIDAETRKVIFYEG